MSYKVIILAIPGIGTHQAGFAKDFRNDIKRFAKGSILENNYNIIEAIPFAQTGVDLNQEAIFSRLNTDNKLGGILSLRKFVIEAFGDGVTFERNASSSNSVYRKVHNNIKEKIKEVNNLKDLNPDAKIVIVAASMGVHLLSTYIWDADNSKGIFENQIATEKENLKNLDYLFSIGCNIPLFVSGMAESEIKPFAKRNNNFKWDNYYDRDDVLGWPLADINNEYNELVNDIEINTGQYIGSHVRYWKDNDFTKPFVKSLISLIS